MADAAPRRRRGVVVIVTVLVLALVAVGLVIGDGYARATAQQQVAASLQNDLGLEKPPTVELGGTPFLAALAQQTFPTARVKAEGVPLALQGKTITADLVEASLKTVHGNFQGTELRADEVAATVVLGWPALVSLAGVPIEYVPDGRIGISYSTSVFGQDVTARVTGRLVLDAAAQTLRIQDPSIRVVGIDLPAEVSKTLIDKLVTPIPMGLPAGLKATSIAIDAEHATLSAAGTNVDLFALR